MYFYVYYAYCHFKCRKHAEVNCNMSWIKSDPRINHKEVTNSLHHDVMYCFFFIYSEKIFFLWLPLDVCLFSRNHVTIKFLLAIQCVQFNSCILLHINFASYSHDFRQIILVSDFHAGIQSPYKKIFSLLMRFSPCKIWVIFDSKPLWISFDLPSSIPFYADISLPTL